MKTLTWQKPGQQNVAQELIKIIINYVAELRLYKITQDATRTINERTAAAKKLQELYPDYFGNLRTEIILIGNAKNAYDDLYKSLEDVASAKIISNQISENENKMVDAINRRNEAQAKLVELNKELEKQQKSNDMWNSNAPAIAALTDQIGLYTKKLNNANEQIKALNESNDKLIGAYKITSTPETDILFKDFSAIDTYKETLSNLDKQLSMFIIDQEEYNRRVNEAKGELIAAADAANIGGSALEKMRDEYVAFNKASIGKEQTEKQKKEAEKQKQVQERINNELLELQHRNEQSRIDLMEEGSDKRIAQIEYDYDREIEAIRKKEKEWREAQGGKLTQEQTVEIKTAVTQAKTTRMRSTQEVEYEQVEAQRKAMNDYLKEYGSYQEKKMALAVEYGQKIADAETEGEKLMLGKQWDKELLDLEIKTKNSSNAIIALFGDMRDKSLKELQELASKGQEALDFIKNGKWDATVGSKLGITEDEFRRWQEAPEAIRQAGESLRGVKDQAETLQPAFDKVTQGLKRFFAAGNDPKKLTESLQLINEGVNEVTSSVQFLSNTFGKLGDSFGGVFSGIAEGLNIVMDAVNSTMQGAQAGAMFGPIGAAAGAAIGVVSSLASAIAKIHDKKNEKRIQKLQDQIDVLDASYEKLGRSIEKAYSTDASQLIDQQNKLLEQQKLLIQQQIKEEQDKKKTDDNRIKEWQKQLDDINAQLEENKEKAIEAITGTDVMSAIDEFAKAYADAWATGEDAAESSAKAVQTLIKTAIIEFLKKKLSPSVQDFMKQLADYMSDGIVSPWEEAELNKLKEKMDKEAQEIFENSGKWLKDESKYEQQATSGGFEVMSQDSANELNGRFTALQMIGEEILLYLQSSNQIANLLYISASIDSINIRIASLYDIADETRVMMANIYIELQQISDNTGDTVKQLKEVVSKLTKIENNTNNL